MCWEKFLNYLYTLNNWNPNDCFQRIKQSVALQLRAVCEVCIVFAAVISDLPYGSLSLHALFFFSYRFPYNYRRIFQALSFFTNPTFLILDMFISNACLYLNVVSVFFLSELKYSDTTIGIPCRHALVALCSFFIYIYQSDTRIYHNSS